MNLRVELWLDRWIYLSSHIQQAKKGLIDWLIIFLNWLLKTKYFPLFISTREREKKGTSFSHIFHVTLHVTDPDNRGPSIFPNKFRGTQRKFSENICSEDDLRSRIFGAFVVKFFACLPLLGFWTSKKWYNWNFLTDFYPKKIT